MPRTRLFHALIVCGAAMTGGAVTTPAVLAVVSAVTVTGCNDGQYVLIDMAIPTDMATGYVTID